MEHEHDPVQRRPFGVQPLPISAAIFPAAPSRYEPRDPPNPKGSPRYKFESSAWWR